MNIDLILQIPSPLKEVLEFEGVYDPELLAEIYKDIYKGLKNTQIIRWGVFGLPGMGKSTICKRVYFHLRRHVPIIYFPEAADYAVKVLGLPIIDFEPFLNKVYKQMEVLINELVLKMPGLIILKEPPNLQNEIYLLIQKSYTGIEHYRRILDKLASGVAHDYWDSKAVSSLSSLITENRTLNNLEMKGPWLIEFAGLTTTNPLEDLSISLNRQSNPNRDPRLTTSNLALLCGYLVGINSLIKNIEQSGKMVMILNPNESIENLSLEMERLIIDSSSL